MRDTQRIANRASHTAGVHPGEEQRGDDAHGDEDTHHPQRLLIGSISSITGFLSLGFVNTNEFLQPGFNLIGRASHFAIGGCHCSFQITGCHRGQVAILCHLIPGLCLGQFVECLTPLRSHDQFAERVKIASDQRARLLDIAERLGLSILRFNRITHAGVVAPDADKLPVNRRELFHARKHIGLDEFFRRIELGRLTQGEQAQGNDHQAEHAETKRRASGQVEFSQDHEYFSERVNSYRPHPD